MLLVASAALVVGTCALSYWIFVESTVSASSHASYAEAEAAGLFRRGWVPASIPATSTDIRELHDLDTNERCASFAVPAPDAAAFLESLRELGFREPSASAEAPERLSPARACPFARDLARAAAVLRRPDPDSAEVEYFAFFEAPSGVYYWSALR
jgi:hypothetical protein